MISRAHACINAGCLQVLGLEPCLLDTQYRQLAQAPQLLPVSAASQLMRCCTQDAPFNRQLLVSAFL